MSEHRLPDDPITDTRPLIAVLVSDLLMATRIEATLRQAEYRISLVADDEAFVEVLQTADLFVLSFAERLLPWASMMRTIRQTVTTPECPILAFGPHVDREAQHRAREAGATQVVSNGLFFARMTTIIDALIAGGVRMHDDEIDT